MNFDTDIRFSFSVPDWQPREATPLQGFAHSLTEQSGLLRLIQDLPSDIYDLAPDGLRARVARKIAGQAPIRWYGQSPRAIRYAPWPAAFPFTFVVLTPTERAEDYRPWLAASPTVTLVTESGGHLKYGDFTVTRVQERLLSVCDILSAMPEIEGAEEAAEIIKSWKGPDPRKAPYEIEGHGTVVPNLAVLRTLGFEGLGEKPFQKLNDGDRPYVEQMVLTAKTILEERAAIEKMQANIVYPRQPDLNIFLPTTYDLKTALTLRPDLDRETKKTVEATTRLLERQAGYNFQLTTEQQIKTMIGRESAEIMAGAEPTGNPIMMLRQREIWLATEAVATLAASEVSAVIRPPNGLNRTRGTIKQFAQHYRSDEGRVMKRAEVFRGVQHAIGDAFPAEFREVLKLSSDGIRVIADAHVEWLDFDGIPLGLRRNVSRIPVTPGNMLIELLSARPFVKLTTSDFAEVLIISALEEKDEIAGIFETAFATFSKVWKDKLQLKFVRVRNEDELVAALNEFEGALVVFDGHGSHAHNRPGVLWTGDQAIDTWNLRGKVTRVPPIVILSACDTHAADRNHATAAGGFLALGTTAVLGSVFPLLAKQAAIFAARLLYRVAEYVPAAVDTFGRSLTWLEIVSGMLRMQASTDILRHLLRAKLLSQEQFEKLHFLSSRLQNGGHPDPFSELRQAILNEGLEATRLDKEIHAALASSSTISYLHLGRPETILITTEKALREFHEDESPSETPLAQGSDVVSKR